MKSFFKLTALVLAGAAWVLLAVSCSHLDDPGPACGGLLEYDAGDSMIVCFPAAAVEFAAENYNPQAYLLREYQIARDPEQTQTGNFYGSTFAAWKNESWLVRRSYLPYPFSHNAIVPDSAEVLFNILTYPAQFGFGWKDTFPDTIDFSDPPLSHIWITDNPDTPGYDGTDEDYTQFSELVVILE